MSTLDTVESWGHGMRLDRWFSIAHPGMPFSLLQRLLRQGHVRVNGGRARTKDKLTEGDSVKIPSYTERSALSSPAPLSQKDCAFIQRLVLYKDEEVIALNKPQGLAVQGGTHVGQHVDHLLDALRFEAPERPRLVHRLDKGTSGLLLLARTRKAAQDLTRLFYERRLQKTYFALVCGDLPHPSGTINLSLQRGVVNPEGRPAITHYHVVTVLPQHLSFVRLTPITGRKHQIRAHLSALNTPILGDRNYGERATHAFPHPPLLYLHAYSMALPQHTLVAPLPQHMKDVLNLFAPKDPLIEDILQK